MSSKRRLRRNSCINKVHYYTIEEANATAAIRRRITGDNIRGYKCDFGHHFHIGHRPAKVQQIILMAMSSRRNI